MPPCDSATSSSTDNTFLKLPPPILGAERFPACVVWTPIPCITWILPFVGHMGICDSNGVCFDFAGPYYISEDNLSFGVATRYFSVLHYIFPEQNYHVRNLSDGGWEIRLTNPTAMPPAQRLDEFDRAVHKMTDKFRRTMMYNFFTKNCHSFTACVLEEDDRDASWNMVVLATKMFFTGRFVSFCRFLWSVLPSVLLYGAIIVLSRTIG